MRSALLVTEPRTCVPSRVTVNGLDTLAKLKVQCLLHEIHCFDCRA